jgi:hypothetical protein
MRPHVQLDDVLALRVRNNDGKMVALAQLVKPHCSKRRCN